MVRLILIPILFPITLISPIVAFKNANITKLRYWVAGLTALIITLFLIIEFLEAHSAALR